MNLADLLLAPWLWPLLFLVPAAWVGTWFLDRKRRARLGRWLGPRARHRALDFNPRRRRLARRFSLLALLCTLLALLEPAWGEGPRAHRQRGVDIMICLDVSRSMLARDQEPSRLEAARREIAALAERAVGDRLGLVAFAGSARLVSPLTLDRKSLVDLAGVVDPLTVERGGTDLGLALESALAALGPVVGGHESILLLTDGEDLAARGERAARQCLNKGVPVHCLGFGSPGGSKIPLAGQGGESFLRDRQGRQVVTALDRDGLSRLARAGGGVFLEAANLPLPLVEIYEKRLLPLARKTFETSHRQERRHRFQWPLLAAFLLWILAGCLSERKS